MDFRDFDILTLPGWHGSGADHWQTHWEASLPNVSRVEQADWEAPDFDAWIDTLTLRIATAAGPVLLVGHSLGAALATRWAEQTGGQGVAGAFLVAVSDRDRWEPDPGEPQGFAPMVQGRLPFPSLVVASTDDPRVSFDRARTFAADWGSRFIDAGALGHIGSAANLGLWPNGLVWLGELAAVAREHSDA